jgi:hypothetical protein
MCINNSILSILKINFELIVDYKHGAKERERERERGKKEALI